jgi:hypothetical protein
MPWLELAKAYRDGVIPTEAVLQAEGRISQGKNVARQIPWPAGESAGLRDDQRKIDVQATRFAIAPETVQSTHNPLIFLQLINLHVLCKTIHASN